MVCNFPTKRYKFDLLAFQSSDWSYAAIPGAAGICFAGPASAGLVCR